MKELGISFDELYKSFDIRVEGKDQNADGVDISPSLVMVEYIPATPTVEGQA
jgi:hypothetical protein